MERWRVLAYTEAFVGGAFEGDEAAARAVARQLVGEPLKLAIAGGGSSPSAAAWLGSTKGAIRPGE